MLCTRQKSSKILHLSPELISSLLSCFSTISVGSFLSFSIYSTQFGVLNSLSKIQVSQLVQFSNGGFFLVGPIVGLLIDKLKVFKFSRFVFHWFGAFLLCTCYCILALFRLEFSVLLVLFAGIGIGTAVIYHKTLSVNSQNVTSAKGVGLPLCAFGIASLFYSVIASLLFYTDGILNISQFLKV